MITDSQWTAFQIEIEEALTASDSVDLDYFEIRDKYCFREPFWTEMDRRQRANTKRKFNLAPGWWTTPSTEFPNGEPTKLTATRR